MRVHVTILAFLVAVLLSGTVTAQGTPVPDRGAELALRSGVAIPFGETQDGTNLDQYASSAIPFILEAGFRIDSSLFVGGRFGYGLAQLKNPNNICTNASCDGSVISLGLEAIYRLMPYQTFAPWVGLGGGYEWASADSSGQTISGGFTLSGLQGLVMVGGDYRANEHLVLGPFLEAAFGRYDSTEGYIRGPNGATTTTTSDIMNTAWHTWLTLGVRGAFGF